ncbi:MAG: MFS transporter [Planctomycetota bacterium]
MYSDPAITSEKAHPRGLYLLFTVEMWERFSFYGMKAILILYLTQALLGDNPGRGWSDGAGSILLGWYGGMAYLLPVIGGIIADKLLGTNRSMYIGGLLISMGHIVLGLTGIGDLNHTKEGMSLFIFGLALIVIGTGHFKPSVSVMVGQLYREHDPRRDGGFAIFYMGINVGAFLGQVVCGYLGEKIGWHWGFGAAAVGMLSGLGLYTALRPKYLHGIGDAPAGVSNYAYAFAFLGILLAAGFAALFHFEVLAKANDSIGSFFTGNPTVGNVIIAAMVAAVLVAAIWFVSIQMPDDRGPTACIFIFTVFNAIFWLAFEQAGTSLNLFARDNTDRMLAGWEVPASWLQNVNPFLIVAMSPLFAWFWSTLNRRGHEISQPMKIAIGLIFLGLGFIFMVFGGKFAAGGVKVSMFWLIALYFWITVGELFLSPTGLSFVTKAAPVRFVSVLMGVWFVSSFVAHLAGGYIAATVEGIERGDTKLPWQIGGKGDFFMLFVVAGIASGVIIAIFTPLLKKLLHGRG